MTTSKELEIAIEVINQAKKSKKWFWSKTVVTQDMVKKCLENNHYPTTKEYVSRIWNAINIYDSAGSMV